MAPVQVWPWGEWLSRAVVHVFVFGAEKVGRSQAGGLLDILCLRTHTGTHAAQISPVSYRELWGGGGGRGG